MRAYEIQIIKAGVWQMDSVLAGARALDDVDVGVANGVTDLLLELLRLLADLLGQLEDQPAADLR